VLHGVTRFEHGFGEKTHAKAQRRKVRTQSVTSKKTAGPQDSFTTVLHGVTRFEHGFGENTHAKAQRRKVTSLRFSRLTPKALRLTPRPPTNEKRQPSFNNCPVYHSLRSTLYAQRLTPRPPHQRKKAAVFQQLPSLSFSTLYAPRSTLNPTASLHATSLPVYNEKRQPSHNNCPQGGRWGSNPRPSEPQSDALTG
jgi:hypothetical protein